MKNKNSTKQPRTPKEQMAGEAKEEIGSHCP